MEISLLLAANIAKMFVMILLGVLLVKTRLCKASDSAGLAAVCLYLCSPCLMYEAFLIEPTQDNINSVQASLLIAFIMQAVIFIAAELIRKAMKLKDQDYLPMIYLNCGNILIPIIISMLGKEYVVYTIGMLIMQTVLAWSHCLSVVSGEKRINLRKIFLNPCMISVFIGAMVFLTGYRPPEFFAGIISDIGGMIGPITMISIGMTLAGLTSLSENLREIIKTALLRLIVMPAVVLPVMYAASRLMTLPDKGAILLVAFLCAAAPSGATLVQMSIKFNNEPEYAGGVNAVSTLMCILTMPVMVYLFQLVV